MRTCGQNPFWLCPSGFLACTSLSISLLSPYGLAPGLQGGGYAGVRGRGSALACWDPNYFPSASHAVLPAGPRHPGPGDGEAGVFGGKPLQEGLPKLQVLPQALRQGEEEV